MDAEFICAYCFQPNSVFADPSGGAFQRYVEDCQVCCRPNVLSLAWDETEETFHIESEPEMDWA